MDLLPDFSLLFAVIPVSEFFRYCFTKCMSEPEFNSSLNNSKFGHRKSALFGFRV